MALVSNIVIDLLSQTATLTATVAGDNVDVITYNNTSKLVTFGERGELIISSLEFLDFCNQINIFQTAILFNYSPNVFLTQPFTQILINELHDPGTWSLTVTAYTDPNVVEYIYTLSTLELYMNKRSASKTLEFPEWLYFLQALNHYKISVKQF